MVSIIGVFLMPGHNILTVFTAGEKFGERVEKFGESMQKKKGDF